MSLQTLMIKAHAEAKVTRKFAPYVSYKDALASALRGLWAVNRGFTGEL